MKKKGLSIAPLVLFGLSILMFGQTGIAQSASEQYVVVGRIVDEAGRPFTNASVFLEPIKFKALSFERFIEGAEIGSDGRFRFELNKKWVTAEGDHFLYVVGEDDIDDLTTIRPPYDWLNQYDKAFNGKLVKFGSEDLIDIGDVRVQFWYGHAKLRIANRIDWNKVYVRIKEAQGRMVYFMSLSKNDSKYIKNSGSELDLSIPEGRWKVELVNWTGKRVFARSPFFDIRRGQFQDVPMAH